VGGGWLAVAWGLQQQRREKIKVNQEAWARTQLLGMMMKMMKHTRGRDTTSRKAHVSLRQSSSDLALSDGTDYWSLLKTRGSVHIKYVNKRIHVFTFIVDIFIVEIRGGQREKLVYDR